MPLTHSGYSLSPVGALEAERVTVYGPGVPGNAWRAHPEPADARTMAETARGAHVLLLTGWLESTALTPGRVGATVARCSIIDVRNVLEPGRWRQARMGGSISRTVFPAVGLAGPGGREGTPTSWEHRRFCFPPPRLPGRELKRIH